MDAHAADGQERKSYFYRPLKEGRSEIRLLRLEGAERHDEPLRGSLQRVNLDDARFTALSYNWGEQKKGRGSIKLEYNEHVTEHIKLGFKKRFGRSREYEKTYDLSIGFSLDAALRHLRQRYGTIDIWNDALCINQPDDGLQKEKPWQLALMSSIYSQAYMVHAWLGPNYGEESGSPQMVREVRDAFHHIRTFAPLLEANNILNGADQNDWLQACFAVADSARTRTPETSRSTQASFEARMLDAFAEPPQLQRSGSDQMQAWLLFAEKLRMVAQHDPMLPEFLKTMTTLSRLPYFSRAWILQETGRASSMTFHYGRQSSGLPYRQVFLALCLASSLRTSLRDSKPCKSLPRFDNRFHSCLTARTTCSQGRTIREVLEAAYFEQPPLHQATEPRDLIFARLGLATDRTGITRKFALPGFEPHVFTEATILLLKNGFLKTLTSFKPMSVRETPRFPDMPSWGYDWSTKGSDAFLKYNASGDKSAQISLSWSPQNVLQTKLTMVGVNIGRIDGQYALGAPFSEVALQSRFSNGAVKSDDFTRGYTPLPFKINDGLIRQIADIYDQLGMQTTEADVDLLRQEHGIPFTSFWRWWLQWATTMWDLCMYNGSPEDKVPNSILELIFRLAPQNLSGVAIARTLGISANRNALIDLKSWSSLLSAAEESAPDANSTIRSFGVGLLRAVYSSAFAMRAASLDTGRLAYVPEPAAANDELVIFYGLTAPLVIRRAGSGNHKIIGPAHVSGVMQGQAMTAGLPSTEYVLV